jgi:hypothetical protein
MYRSRIRREGNQLKKLIARWTNTFTGSTTGARTHMHACKGIAAKAKEEQV